MKYICLIEYLIPFFKHLDGKSFLLFCVCMINSLNAKFAIIYKQPIDLHSTSVDWFLYDGNLMSLMS